MLDELSKEKIVANMTNNLVVLRTKLRLTQIELARRVGIGRQTLMDIENKKRPMTWSTFMSLLCIFRENKDTSSLLDFYCIYTEELGKFITISESMNQEK